MTSWPDWHPPMTNGASVGWNRAFSTGLPQAKMCSGLLGIAKDHTNTRPSDCSSPLRGTIDAEGVSSGETADKAAEPKVDPEDDGM